jgi:hypothetical protein
MLVPAQRYERASRAAANRCWPDAVHTARIGVPVLPLEK